MTRYAPPRSEHERRLTAEGAFLARLFTLLAPHFGVYALGTDGFILSLAERLDVNLPGLTAIRVRIGEIEATAVVAPGVAFGNPELFADLKRLRFDANSRGRRVVLIPKRTLKAHARRRLPASSLIERPGRSRNDRRRAKAANFGAQLNSRLRVPAGGAEGAPASLAGADRDA